MSSLCRGGIFFCVNLPSGLDAGTRAFAVELGFRAIASGILGSTTEAFRNVMPAAHGMTAVLLVIPAVGHSAEYTVHRLAHTARLEESITASVAFTMVSTAFNLFAMRRGALIVGAGRQSLLQDLRRMPQLVAGFVLTILDHRSRLRGSSASGQ